MRVFITTITRSTDGCDYFGSDAFSKSTRRKNRSRSPRAMKKRKIRNVIFRFPDSRSFGFCKYGPVSHDDGNASRRSLFIVSFSTRPDWRRFKTRVFHGRTCCAYTKHEHSRPHDEIAYSLSGTVRISETPIQYTHARS